MRAERESLIAESRAALKGNDLKMTGKHDAVALAARVRAALGRKRAVTEKKMMGGICFLLRGHMLCGTAKPGYMFRVGKEQDAAALARPGAKPIAFTGRRMPGFVWVDPDRCDARALKGWLALAERYVKSLPPKPDRAPGDARSK